MTNIQPNQYRVYQKQALSEKSTYIQPGYQLRKTNSDLLLEAICNNDESQVTELTGKGIRFLADDPNVSKALDSAIADMNFAVATALLKHGAVIPNHRQNNKYASCFTSAIENRNAAFVKVMLDSGFTVNPNDVESMTAISTVLCSSPSVETADILKTFGVHNIALETKVDEGNFMVAADLIRLHDAIFPIGHPQTDNFMADLLRNGNLVVMQKLFDLESFQIPETCVELKRRFLESIATGGTERPITKFLIDKGLKLEPNDLKNKYVLLALKWLVIEYPEKILKQIIHWNLRPGSESEFLIMALISAIKSKCDHSIILYFLDNCNIPEHSRSRIVLALCKAGKPERTTQLPGIPDEDTITPYLGSGFEAAFAGDPNPLSTVQWMWVLGMRPEPSSSLLKTGLLATIRKTNANWETDVNLAASYLLNDFEMSSDSIKVVAHEILKSNDSRLIDRLEGILIRNNRGDISKYI